ncbi:hypothetical protein BDZ97DRAFT_1875445 [Flammula alnicola]|nr:hypothetical protein BDZ97DRAFT_1875445 [Flammula alnicola]
MATKNIQGGDRVQSSGGIQAEGKLDITSSDNPAVQLVPEPETDVVMHTSEVPKASEGQGGAGESKEKEQQKEGEMATGEEAPEEGDQTKEGKPAEAGEKRERPTVTEEGEDKAGAEELEEAEKETGKEVKKPKTGEAHEEHETEEHHEGKKAAAPKKRRHSKASAKSKPKPAAAAPAEGKRPVGRPRKASTVAAKAQEAPQEGQQAKEVAEDQKMEDTIPAHHTRSRT